MPHSKNRRVEIVIWDNGKAYIIPIFWCDRLLGLMTLREAQDAKARIDAWTERTGTN